MKSLGYLKKYFGFSNFREGQDKIIDSVLKKNDTLGIMPTGGGKSLCYQVPALCFEGLTIVISPLISLMKDQIDYLNSIKYPAGMLNSTVPIARQEMIKELIEAGELKLLYLTPERFRNENFLNWISSIKISLFVIDEAHCISEWGHDFRPEYIKLSGVIKKLNTPVILALTATATEEVGRDITASLKMKNPNVFVSGFNRENLIYGVKNLNTREEKNKELFDFVNKVQVPGIIYTSSIKDTEFIYNFLKTNIKRRIGIYHGSLNPVIRKKMQDDFLDNKIDILTATNAFGMGINKKDIRFVVHYSIPGSIEAYYQETGRAGRDGETGYCLLLYLDEDKRIQDFFIESQNPPLKTLMEIFNSIKNLSKSSIIYTDDDQILMNSNYNSFTINTVIKQLHHIGCIDYDYISQDKIEIKVKGKDIEKKDIRFLEELFSNSINKKTFASLLLIEAYKRVGLREKEFLTKIDELSNKKMIEYKLIKKGQVIIIKKNEMSLSEQKEYEKKVKRKIEIDKKQLDMMIQYANLEECRRHFLLGYFGEKYHEKNCKKCDICRGTYQNTNKIQWSDIQKSIFYFFIHHDGKIGKVKGIKILKGSYDIDPKFRNWEEYGQLKSFDISDIEGEFNLLIKNDFLEYSKGKYEVINITKKGLKEIRDFNLKK